MTGITIRPADQEARFRFRFCCALNPQLSQAGQGVLPEYIEQRTIPAIPVDYHDEDSLRTILRRRVSSDDKLIASFTEWYRTEARWEVSVRQAITLLQYAAALHQRRHQAEDAVREAATYVFKADQKADRRARPATDP